MFITILYIIQVLICGALIVLITSSDKEAEALGGAIGGGGGGGGKGKFKAGYEEQMDNITKYFAIGFFVFSMLIAHFIS